jgi:hypothetical protein
MFESVNDCCFQRALSADSSPRERALGDGRCSWLPPSCLDLYKRWDRRRNEISRGALVSSQQELVDDGAPNGSRSIAQWHLVVSPRRLGALKLVSVTQGFLG